MELSKEEMRELEGKQMQETEQVHLSYASFEQKLLFMVENENRILDEIHKFKEELSALDASKGDASEEIKAKEDEIANIHQTIADSKELFVEIEEEID